MNRRSLVFILLLTASFYLINEVLFPPKNRMANNRPPEAQEVIAQKADRGDNKTDAALASKERFYVLENESMQLVFSTLGGSIAEINLPLKDGSHPNSSILPIGIDTKLRDESAANNRFPLKKYRKVNSSGREETFSQGNEGGYYPLLRRDIVETQGKEALAKNFPSRYYATNIGAYDEVEPETYTVTSFSNTEIVMQSNSRGRQITKTFSLPEKGVKAPYVVNLSVKVSGDEGRRLYMTTGIPEVELISGRAAPTLKYRVTRGGKGKVEKSSLPKEGKNPVVFSSEVPDWVCNSNGFFGVILDSLTENPSGFNAGVIAGTDTPSRLSLVESQYNTYPAKKFPGYQMSMPLPLTSKELKYRIFAGPLQKKTLVTLDDTFSNSSTGYNPDYVSAQSYHGWFSFISEPFAKFLFLVMNLFHMITGSWGISIILLTFVLRIMLFPLNSWSIRSTVKMQEIAPKVSEIQKKYKGDPKRSQMEVMMLYREAGVNPFGGCLPILIQMPFLIGMFDLLKSSFELRGASFIPGWIPNLTAPDVVFSWSFPLPIIGSQFHILPVLLAGVMFVQQRFSSMAPKDPALMTDQQRQQKAMGNIMVVVFAVMFYNFPSGLNLYWLSSMLLGILQQMYMQKKYKLKKS